MKFYQALATSCLMMLSVVSGAAAESQSVLIVTEESYPLSFSSTIEGGREIEGLATNLVREVMDKAQLEYELLLLPWARAIKKTETNRNVLIYSIARTQAREQQYKWVGEVIKLDYWLYGLKSNPMLGVGRQENDLRDLKVGVVRNDIFHRYLRDQGYKNLVVLESGERLLSLLDRGRIDLLPSNSIGLRPFCQHQEFDCERLTQVKALEEISTALYMAFNLDSEDQIVRKATAAYDQLRASGRYDEIMAEL